MNRITSGQARSLTDKLQNALASIHEGPNEQAISQFNAFIDSVQSSLKTGKLSAKAAAALIAAANAIVAVL